MWFAYGHWMGYRFWGNNFKKVSEVREIMERRINEIQYNNDRFHESH